MCLIWFRVGVHLGSPSRFVALRAGRFRPHRFNLAVMFLYKGDLENALEQFRPIV